MRGTTWAVAGLVVGFSLACGGSQSEEDALKLLCAGASTCSDCPDSAGPDFVDALAAHLDEGVQHPETRALLSDLRSATDAERSTRLQEAATKVTMECALAGVFEQRDKAYRARQVAKLCALGSTCAEFDGSDPSTVKTCAKEALDPVFAAEVARMHLGSGPGLANNLEAFAKKHTTAGCALAIVLRDAQ